MRRTYETVQTTRISRADRRELVEQAAAQMFAKYGFRGTTTKEIAACAGVSEASLFQYFNSKAELYAAVLAGKAKNFDGERMIEINEYAANGDDENLFRTIAEKISEQYRTDAEFLRLMLYSALEGHSETQLFYASRINSLSEFLARYIERRQREKAFQPCDPEAAARGFIGAQIHCAMTKMLSGGNFENAPEQQSIGDFTKLTLDGLRSGATRRKRYAGIF